MKLKLEIALQKELPTTRSFSSLASLFVELKHNQSAQEHQNRMNEKVHRLCGPDADGGDGITIAIA